MSAGELITTLLTEHRNFVPSQLSTTDTPLGALQLQVQRLIRHIWADNTWNQRANLYRRFSAFCKEHRLEDLDETLDWAIPLFVESTETLPSTRLTYSKHLSALFHRMGHVTPIVQSYQCALRAVGGLIPQSQAVPATIEQVDRLLLRAISEDRRLHAALFLAFKTASRWDDILGIKGCSVSFNTPEEIIIDWRDRTKTTRADPFRASSWAVVRHHAPMDTVSNTLAQLEPEEPLLDATLWETSRLVQWLRKEAQTEELTAHSFKRGAVAILAKKSTDGLLLLELIPRLAKHKTPTDFTPTTLRYIADPSVAARLMGTQAATILLECSPYPHEARYFELPNWEAQNDEGPQQELPRQQAWVADFAGNRPIDRVRNKNSALRTEMALRREVAPEESL